MNILAIYEEILGYDLEDKTKFNTFRIDTQKIYTWEAERSKRFRLAKEYGFSLDTCWSKRRFEIFIRLAKKKTKIENERLKTWDSDTDDAKV